MTDVTLDPSQRGYWTSDQEVRWCPGCGDYGILAAVQMLHTELDVKREDTVFVSGIGCAARFPYYMSTYGMHGIHGRASVAGSRRYGRKTGFPSASVPLSSVANGTLMSGRDSTSGRRHGSAPLAR